MDHPGLAALLRSETARAHERAEGTAFVGALVDGTLPLPGYVDLLAQLHGVYAALERAAVGHRRTPHGAQVAPAGLDRAPAIEHDLAVLAPGHEVRLLPAARAYVARVAEVADDLGAWVAHAYTRYLGDLSGGRVLRGAVQRHHGVPDDGVTFYDFADLPKPKVFKDEYRARLDALPLDDAARAAVAAEACVAFDLNTALLSELGARHLPGPSRGRPAPSAAARRA